MCGNSRSLPVILINANSPAYTMSLLEALGLKRVQRKEVALEQTTCVSAMCRYPIMW